MLRLNIPYTDNREIEEIEKVLATGFLTQGPKVEEFERSVAALVGCEYAFAMSSCTTALHLSLVTLGIREGDEVLVADFTFPATANVVVQLGARPIFVDIDPRTYTMDPVDLRAKITPRSRALIPVHTFGCSADMSTLCEVAGKAGLPIVEDAACALGTTFRGKACGSLGTMGCFSFHPRKVITTGEGGMITTNDRLIADRIRLLRSHGGVRDGNWYSYEEAGFNYRMSDINGAVGVAQMEKLEWILAQKRRHAAALRDRIAGIPGIQPPVEPAWQGHIYQSFVVKVAPGLDRDSIVSGLRAHGVEATLGTYALHAQPFFQRHCGCRPGDVPHSYEAFRKTITLPLYPQMSDGDIDTVARALGAAVGEAGRGS